MSKADYGIDAPIAIRNLLGIGCALVAAGSLLPFLHLAAAKLRMNVSGMFEGTGLVLIFEGLLMVIYAKWGKFRQRDRILERVKLEGDARVLDVGTGRGLLMIGAAKRLTKNGRAVGIDIWNAGDLSGNALHRAAENVRVEGVAERAVLLTGDARQMDFSAASFDAVVSNLCLHNIPDAAGRREACREIARVLKPGGAAVISDFKCTGLYADTFRAAGLEVQRSWPYLDTFPPLRIVTARKAE